MTDVFPYHVIELPIYLWIQALLIFAWNFIDLFIILISVALATRFNQIHSRLITSIENNGNSESFWAQIRKDYYSMINLVDKVDQEISSIILIDTGLLR